MKKGRQCMLMHKSCVVECVLVCMVRFWCKIISCMCWTKTVFFFFLSVKTELLVNFEPKLKWDPIVILNNISWVYILLSEENNLVYSFAQIK